jgi:hypothetical protein
LVPRASPGAAPQLDALMKGTVPDELAGLRM